MAITIISQPPALSFAGNQIVFSLESDNYQAQAGVTFSGRLIQTEQWTVGKTFVFQFGDERVTMTAALVPDNTGYQFPASSGGLIITMDFIATYFRKNYVLNNYFIMEVDGDDNLQFVAREKGSFYNWNPSAGLTIDTLGVDAKEKPGFKFLFEVFLENEAGVNFERIYSEKLNSDLPFTGKLTIDIQEILEAALGYDVPNPNSNLPFRCKKSKRRYYCRYGEVYGNPARVQQFYQTANLHVTSGGFSYIGFKTRLLSDTLMPYPGNVSKDTFLKQPGPVPTALDQPQFLYFINMREGRLLYFKTVVVHSDGSTSNQKIFSIYAEQYEKIAFASGYDQQQLALLSAGKTVVKFLCGLVSEADSALSDLVTYSVAQGYKSVTRYLLYSSSMGGFDSFLAYGKGSEDYKVDQLQAEKQLPVNYDLAYGTLTNYELSVQRNYTINTGWIEKYVFDGLADFFLAEVKFLFQAGKLLPVTATNKKAGEYNDDTSLIRQVITITMNYNEYKFTDGDLEGAPSYPPPLTGLVHYGFSGTKPLTEADVKALPYSQSDSIHSFIMNTGLHRICTVAYPAYLQLHEVYDQTSEEDVTSEYLVNHSAFTVDGIPYKVDTVIIAIPYPSNHEHKITLTNE